MKYVFNFKKQVIYYEVFIFKKQVLNLETSY